MTRIDPLIVCVLLSCALSSALAKSWDGPLNVACPDGSACPDDNTCCPADPTNSTFGCCPAPNATCCLDYVHCCPDNYPVCDLTKGECTTEDGLVSVHWHKKTPSVQRPLDVPCPDGSTCPVGNTCCPGDPKNSTFGCCPAPNATCCSDFRSCCPEDYPVCHVTTGVCSKSEDDLEDTVPILSKLPSSFTPLSVNCPDGSACPDDNTCCPADATNSSYGCCPSPNATCCDDYEHCCPSEYPVCDLSQGECTTEDAYVLRTSMLVQYPPGPVSAADSVTCPDSSTCPDDSTCCPTDSSGSSYACCPAPGATCCTDYEHCCPKDYPVCDLSAGSCNAAGAFPLAIPWMTKIKSQF